MSTESKGSAIVTGAAQGIGRGVALRLALDGFDVIVNDLQSKTSLLETLKMEIEGKGRKAVVVTGDATSETTVQGLIDAAVLTYGSLDVMVANAGSAYVKPILETSLEEMESLFSTNFKSCWLAYRLAASQMIKQGRGGRIIGACSITGKKGHANMSVYSASKFAVRGLTQSAAQEWGPHGITVNAYAPGMIWTPLIENLSVNLMSVMGQEESSPEIAKNAWGNLASVKRIGAPPDIAHLVSLLASKDAGFITGQTITCDGGTIFD